MIGVFDSGHGGLTVLRALTDRLPRFDYVYLGDHAHAPYGARDVEAIYELTRDSVERLFSIGCRLVLLACNTASAVALRRLQQTWLPMFAPEHRVLGVVVPAIEAITEVPWHVTAPREDSNAPPRTVMIFATRRTVESGSFPYEIGLRAPAIKVIQQACPGLVDAIETDGPDAEIAGLVAGFVAQARAAPGGAAPDSAILGCTHYPLVARHFAAALPAGVEILDQPAIVAESLESYLKRHPEFDRPSAKSQPPRFFTTGDPARVNPLATRFYGEAVAFEAIENVGR
jgi:glutamate racemase